MKNYASRHGVLVCLLMAALAHAAIAGTIRDDRDDSLYTGLASQPGFQASGYLRIGPAGSGGVASGTLIDSVWVLTAGHCVVGESGATATSWSFEVAGQTVTIPLENVYAPRDYISSGFDSGYDVALLRLPTPIRGVRPAALSAGADEIGKVITSLGYGTTGNGRTGNTGAPGTRRAGQNVIDAYAATISVPSLSAQPIPAGSTRTLLYDFDNPQATMSTIGSRNPLQLEYSGSPGDSGGGAFVLFAGGVRVIGVVSAGFSPIIDGAGRYQSSYGTTAVYARVSSNIAWIRSAVAGREPPLPTLIASINRSQMQTASAVSRARVTMAARKGWLMSHLVAPSPGPEQPEAPVFVETRATFGRLSSEGRSQPLAAKNYHPRNCPDVAASGSLLEDGSAVGGVSGQ